MNNFRIAEEIIPDPESLLESIRSVGYSLKEAISDLLDNSISAQATKVKIILERDGDLEFHLFDNGKGMDLTKLVSAFRLGSTNPKEVRSDNDLGRFGMGLKTASLSQCRQVTVTTKQNNLVISRTLDLDEVAKQKKWIIGELNIPKRLKELFNTVDSGTIVSWKKINQSSINDQEFQDLLLEIRNYISVCFHRFMERTNKKVSFYLNNVKIKSTSPIVEGSQVFSEVSIDGVDSTMTAFTIPIRLHNQEYSLFNSFELFNGVENQQGVYIYRSDRLLCFGGWLGIVKPNNSYKLCRVVIDFENDYHSDIMWSIDIKKTKAEIPYVYKQEIKNFVKKAQLDSSRKIGKYNKRELRQANNDIYDNIELWKIKKNDKYRFWEYSINLENPIFSSMLSKISKNELTLIFDIISRNIPIADIIDNNDDEPAYHDTIYAEIDIDEVLEKEKRAARLAVDNAVMLGLTKKDAIDKVVSVEPFSRHKEELLKHLKL